jgi:hypothetical protein
MGTHRFATTGIGPGGATRYARAFSAALALAMAAGSVHAQDCDQDGVPDSQQIFRWKTGTGFWGSPSNWSSAGGGAPNTTSLAVFDGADGLGQQPYAPFFDGFAGVRGLGVLNCTANFGLGGSVFAVSGDQADCREFLLGGPLGAVMTVSGGGQFRVNRGVIGDVSGTTSRLVLDGVNGALQFRHLNPAPLIIGQFGTGKVELIDTQMVHDGPLVLGSRPGSDGTLSVFGTSELLLSAEGASDVIVGFFGSGFIGLEQDGLMESNGPVSMRLGDRAGSFGEARFSALDLAQTVVFSQLEIGRQGDGEWDVLGGTNFDALMTGRLALGVARGSSGEARILGVSRWGVSGAPVEIGPGGRGDVSIGEGSLLDASAGVRVFVDGVIEGSGDVAGDVDLFGGELRPVDFFAETGARQVLSIDGDLSFSGPNPLTGRFETGRLVYTLVSDDPQRSMSVQATGAAFIDGTLRVFVPRGVVPIIGEKYPVVEAGQMTGVFRGVQTTVVEGAAIAVPLYSGDGDAFIEFFDFGPAGPSLQQSQSADPPGLFTDAVVRDVNLDGFPDLVGLADNGPGQNGLVVIALNLGVAPGGAWLGFSQTVQVFDSLGDLPGSLAIGDMNGDELPDLVIMNRGPASGQIRIRLNSPGSPGDFSGVDPRAISVLGTPADIALADYSGDGLLDVVTVFDRATRGGSGGGIKASTNTGGGGFDEEEEDIGDDPGSVDTMGGEATPTGVAATSEAEATVRIFGVPSASSAPGLQGRGQGFPLFFLQDIPTGREPAQMFTADLSGDGLDDVITSDAVSGTISVMVAQDFGEIVYADAISLDAGTSRFRSAPGSIVAADVNDDGRLDLAYTALDEKGERELRTILNIATADQGELIFGDSEVVDLPNGEQPRLLAAADLDANGSQDLVVVRDPGTGSSVASLLAPGQGPCNAADLAVPFGVLDLSDINTFVNAFVSQSPAADIAPPFGVFDLADLNLFSSSFLAGCP